MKTNKQLAMLLYMDSIDEKDERMHIKVVYQYNEKVYMILNENDNLFSINLMDGSVEEVEEAVN